MLKVTYLPQNMSACCQIKGTPALQLSLVLLFDVSLSSGNLVPKKGTDNFRIGGANLQIGSGDGGVSLWNSGCQDCLVNLN